MSQCASPCLCASRGLMLSPVRPLLSSESRASADVHEQRRPWVPLMLETSYRPNGWLGIMLGSRLYYEFTEAALSNAAEWERVADSVSQEVRRHGAPPPSFEAAADPMPQEGVVTAAAAAVPVSVAPAAPFREAVRSPPVREGAAGVSVSVVHNTNHISNNSNIGNTILLL